MIDIDRGDITALEKENERIRERLQSMLETPVATHTLDRKELERINYQLVALASMTRKLWEQNEIAKHHTDSVPPDFWNRPSSTI